MRSRLPVGGPPVYELTVVARDGGDPPMENAANLIIRVESSSTTPLATSTTTGTTTTTITTTTTSGPRAPPVFSRSRLDVQVSAYVINKQFMISCQLTFQVDENLEDTVIARVTAAYPDNEDGEINYVLKRGDPTLFQ